METLLSVNQVAFILKVHPLTIRRYIKEGKLKAVKVAGNVRIKETELSDFNNKEVSPTPLSSSSIFKEKKRPPKNFNDADPFLRMQGRGASLHLST